jgi:hypothetical protein
VCVELFCLKLFILAIIPALIVTVSADVPNQTIIDDALPPDEYCKQHGSGKATAKEWEYSCHCRVVLCCVS